MDRVLELLRDFGLADNAKRIAIEQELDTIKLNDSEFQNYLGLFGIYLKLYWGGWL